MKTILALVTKSPWPQGRIGKINQQDWYQTCVLASLLHKKINNSEVIVSSAAKIKDAKQEEEYYIEAMKGLNTPLITLRKGYETITQLEIFKEYATERSAKLILLTTWSHYPRVKWVCLRHNIKCEVKFSKGLPRPWELFTDAVIFFPYIIISLIGLEKWFVKKVTKRRQSGKL
jgi:hypothetical protein